MLAGGESTRRTCRAHVVNLVDADDEQVAQQQCEHAEHRLRQQRRDQREEGGRLNEGAADAGCAAGLAHQWGDRAGFRCASLNDRAVLRPPPRAPSPGPDGDATESLPATVVLCCPDPTGLASTRRITSECEESTVDVVLFNPRLFSGDVGIGTNVRRAAGAPRAGHGGLIHTYFWIRIRSD